MKNFANISRFFGKLIVPAFAALAFSACDSVGEYDRYVPLPEMDDVERVVLLQDFTGQNCINCPSAHEIMELLMEQYGTNLICVSVHAGDLAIPVSRTRFTDDGYQAASLGLKTDEGDEYNNAASVAHWPMGTVDGGPAVDPDQWSASIRSQLSKDPAAKIEIEAQLVDGKILITSDLLASSNFSGKYTLWVVESNLVGRQRGESGNQNDYVHNHVFRTSVNGTWGEEITLEEGMRRELSHSIDLRYNDSERWNPANISIVGFISDGAGVQQAAECKLNIDN